MRILLVASAVAMTVAVAFPLAACGQSNAKDDPAPKRNAAATSVPEARAQAKAARNRREPTEDDMVRRAVARFDRADADGDGRLTGAELTSMRARPNLDGDAADQGQSAGRRNRQDRQRGGRIAGLARADRNGDGIVTRTEVEDQARLRFKRRDVDGDGVISRDEPAGRRQRNRQGSGGSSE